MLCDAAGHLKLADFGSAVDHGAQAEEEAGRVEGTADYVAPEVAGGQHRVSFASDAWALGCVLFQLIAGHSPVTACHGEEHAATLCRVVQFSTEDHGLFPEGFAAELQPVVQQLLLADPAARLLGGWSKVLHHNTFGLQHAGQGPRCVRCSGLECSVRAGGGASGRRGRERQHGC